VREAVATRPDLELNVEHAGHAFENSDAPMFHVEEAARSSWAKTVAFLRAHLPPGPAGDDG
jgi:carboxymethylenebutenolidase